MVPENEHRLRERTKKSAPALTIIQSNHTHNFSTTLNAPIFNSIALSDNLPFTFISILDDAIAWIDLTIVRSRFNQDFSGRKSGLARIFPLRSRCQPREAVGRP